MKDILVLDCTLRDGGYCNQWNFGFDNIKKICRNLVSGNIDIIECGFLTDKTIYSPEITKFTKLEEISPVIPDNRNGKIFVVMMNYGEYEAERLPDYDGNSIDGIRVAFHKKDLFNALEQCKVIQKKGYKVFIQAMVSLCYSDDEFLELIHKVNELNPYAFYIVDSFGMMKEKDLIRLFYMVEHNLKQEIHIGFHSHNNMQLAYSNAQTLIETQTARTLIIDSSIYGMGRGAGNLNTELLVEYLNDNAGTHYNLKPLLIVIDEILAKFHSENYWGYTLPNYLSAKYNIHPNYAGYLDAKKTLTVENMDEIFSMIDEDKRVSFDKNYIEDLYVQYMENGTVQEERLNEFQEYILKKNILVIAPGKTSWEEAEKIISYSHNKDLITISINYDYDKITTDYIFISNLRRYKELDINKHHKCIVTSNIPATDIFLKVKYAELTNIYEAIHDNAGMMLIKFLTQFDIKKIIIAGMDGYSTNTLENYADHKMNVYIQNARTQIMNRGMNKALHDFSQKVDIEFLTTPRYIKI